MTHEAESSKTQPGGDSQNIPTPLTARDFAGGAPGHFARRTALNAAAFFLPYVKAGMRLLDCGCGPGTISIGLGEIVAPGELVGIDTNDHFLEAARGHAQERGLTNARFEHADIHSLPFDAGSFDAAIVSRVLEHLPDPVVAMREVRRVLRPGGIVGISSPDYGGAIIAPIDPLLERWLSLHRELRESYGGNPLMGRFLRATLLEAGFVRGVGSVFSECYGDSEGTRTIADTVVQLIGGDLWGGAVVARSLADRGTLDQIAAAWRAWGERPDAMYATPHGEAVGWAP